MNLDSHAMDTLVAEHLYREGRPQTARFLVQTSGIELPHEEAFQRLHAVHKVSQSVYQTLALKLLWY